MSPSWRDRIHIALCPDRVLVVRFRRGLRRRVAEKNTLVCPAHDPAGPDAAIPIWQSAVDALSGAVQSWKGGAADATLILSNHFVRYLLVPWSDALNGEQETKDFARHCFLQTYGDAAASWDIRLGSDGAGAPRVASAVEPALLEAVARAFRASPLRLRSVQPYLMAAYNQWRHSFHDKTAWFALAERNRLCLARFHQNHWHSLRTIPVRDSIDAALPALLQREAYLTNLPASDANVFVCGAEPDRSGLPAQTGLRVQQLRPPACPGFSPAADREYAMAMSG